MNITKVAKLTDTSAHTLRYYEKLGLIVGINRNASGHREFTESDLVWIQFIKRLKATNMPLVEMKKFAELRAKGDDTPDDRVRMLKNHRNRIDTQIKKLHYHQNQIDEKIFFCKQGGDHS